MEHLPALAAGRQTPAQFDQEALSRASSRGVRVWLKADWRFPNDGPSYAAGYLAEIGIDSAPPGSLADELERDLLAPAPREPIEKWLAMLQATCARRSEDAASAAVSLRLYTQAMGRFPADVALHACSTWRSPPSTPGARAGPNWFPTLAELVEACERLAAPRRALIAALRTWKPPTQAQILEAEADRWSKVAYEARDEAFRLRRTDPEGALRQKTAEAEAFREAKRLRIEAREAAKS